VYLATRSRMSKKACLIRSTPETGNHTAMTINAPSSLAEVGSGEPSIQGPFPARVKGWRMSGERFISETRIENLSAYYCRVHLAEHLEPSDCLFVAVRIYKAVVLLRGRVLQTLLRADGTWDVDLRITRYRFIHRRGNSD
jgi:hypothetical protein